MTETSLMDRPIPVDENAGDGMEVWAAAHLADVPIVLTFREEGETDQYTDEHGVERREVPWITVTPFDKAPRFRIYFNPDVTHGDYDFALKVVEAAKSHGLSRAWEEVKRASGAPSYFRFSGLARNVSAEPDERPIAPCPDPSCLKMIHCRNWRDEGERHLHDIWSSSTPGLNYEIEIYRDDDPDEEPGWKIGLYADDFYAPVRSVASFQNDLAYAMADCRHLNEGKVVPVSKPYRIMPLKDGQR